MNNDYTMPTFYAVFFTITLFSIIIQTSLVQSLGVPLRFFSLPLTVVFFSTIIFHNRLGFYLSMAFGFFLELFSPLFPGALFMAYIISNLAMNSVFENFFTNRSLYSLAINVMFGTLFYSLIVQGAFSFNYYFGGILPSWDIVPTVFAMIFNTSFSIVIFLIMRKTSKSLLSQFIVTRS